MAMVTQKMETYKTKLAIVLLNWNGKKWLEKFLPTLITHSDKAEIYVIDNQSSDDSISYIKNNYKKVNLIINQLNGGYAKGYNDGLKKIDAEYFILINSDIEVTKNWTKPIIDLMESSKQIAACQPKILDYNNKHMFEYAGASGGFIDYLGYPYCRGRIFNNIESDQGQYNDPIEIFWATGACICVRSKYFEEINGFDEDFFAHQEEIDLCWRFKNKKYKIMCQPKSTVFHVGGGTLDPRSSFKTYLNFRNNLYMLFKNLHILDLLIVIPVRLVLDGVAALTFIINKNGIAHFYSIIKAHFSFYCNIFKLISKRKEIKQKRGHTGKTKNSIVFASKIKNISIFSKLK